MITTNLLTRENFQIASMNTAKSMVVSVAISSVSIIAYKVFSEFVIYLLEDKNFFEHPVIKIILEPKAETDDSQTGSTPPETATTETDDSQIGSTLPETATTETDDNEWCYTLTSPISLVGLGLPGINAEKREIIFTRKDVCSLIMTIALRLLYSRKPISALQTQTIGKFSYKHYACLAMAYRILEPAYSSFYNSLPECPIETIKDTSLYKNASKIVGQGLITTFFWDGILGNDT